MDKKAKKKGQGCCAWFWLPSTGGRDTLQSYWLTFALDSSVEMIIDQRREWDLQEWLGMIEIDYFVIDQDWKNDFKTKSTLLLLQFIKRINYKSPINFSSTFSMSISRGRAVVATSAQVCTLMVPVVAVKDALDSVAILARLFRKRVFFLCLWLLHRLQSIDQLIRVWS